MKTLEDIDGQTPAPARLSSYFRLKRQAGRGPLHFYSAFVTDNLPGGTVHDVAQVVGAGYSLGKEAGDIATVVKLLRVAMLLPVILVLSILLHSGVEKRSRPPLLPWFAVAFGILVAINSLVNLPKPFLSFAGGLSRFALVVAISAIGMRTSLKELTVLG